MADVWREGPARSMDPDDECPACLVRGKCVFAADFKKMGRQSVRACGACQVVSHNGKQTGVLTVHKEA